MALLKFQAVAMVEPEVTKVYFWSDLKHSGKKKTMFQN